MPRVVTHCHFIKPIRYDEPLEMRMTVGEIADKTITYACQILSKEEKSS